MKHSEFSKSAIVARFSQRTRNLLLFTAYQCVLEGEERAWNKHGERYEHLHPRERLAQYLGVHKSHLSNYFNGRTAIPDDVAERAFDLIPEHLQPYFAIQELCAVLIDLAQLFPKYRQPHEFEFFWNLPHLAERAGEGMASSGEVRVRYEFEWGKGEPSVGEGKVVFGADDHGHPRVRMYDKFAEGKQLVMGAREIGSGVEGECRTR
jgi:hypothetical protein